MTLTRMWVVAVTTTMCAAIATAGGPQSCEGDLLHGNTAEGGAGAPVGLGESRGAAGEPAAGGGDDGGTHRVVPPGNGGGVQEGTDGGLRHDAGGGSQA